VRIAVRTDGITGGAVLFRDSPFYSVVRAVLYYTCKTKFKDCVYLYSSL
jgi:hypothetical protein